MLVTLEGLDGSGKTTCIDALRESAAIPSDTTFTREPTHSWYGEAVRRSLGDDDADSLAELFLYTADHAAHLSDTILPALERSELVVSDRYSDSRYAYQGATLADRFDDPVEFIREIHQPWTRPPDVTIYFDLDPETAAERTGKANKFERVEHLRRVRANYERLIEEERDRFVRIDADRPAEAVHDDVMEVVETLL